jgi:translocation and assembly module TamB
MKQTIRKRTLPWLACLAAFGICLTASLHYFFLRDQALTRRINFELQKCVAVTGLKIKIGNIHWLSWDRLVCKQVYLTDPRDGNIPLQVSRLNLKLDLITLLKDLKHPETALREIELVNPRIELSHLRNGTWNISRYFPKNGRDLQLQTILKITNGSIGLRDYQYGKCRLLKVNGRVNLDNYPAINWRLKGTSDLNNNLYWTSGGIARIDQRAGLGDLAVSRLQLDKLVRFLPLSSPYQARAGSASVDLKFAWSSKGFWIENGRTTVSDAEVYLPKLHETFQVQRLQAEFTPALINIREARLLYKQTVIKLYGKADTKTSKVSLAVNAEGVQLSDLMKLNPGLQKIKVEGLANAKLKIDGPISAPVLNGDIFLTDARVVVADKEIFEQIAGRIIIVRNDLNIERLEGQWRGSIVGISGRVYNLLQPRLDLKVYGKELELKNAGFIRTGDFGLQIDGKVDFSGTITGDINQPVFSGATRFERLAYQGVWVKDLQVNLAWNSATESLQILQLDGLLWDGHLTAGGEIRINSEGVKWSISSAVSDLNLGDTGLGADFGAKGKISVDAMLKGHWEPGRPFEPGNVLGTFHSARLNLRDAAVDSTEGVFSWIDGDLMVDSIQAKIGQGLIYGHFLLNKSGLALSFNAENIKLRQLLSNEKKYPFTGIFEGSFVFEGPLNQLTGKISGTFHEAAWNSKPIGTISGDILYGDQSLEITTIQVVTDSGDFIVSGRIDLQTEPSIAFNINSDNVRLKGMLNWLPVDPVLKIDGSGIIRCKVAGPITNPNFQGEIEMAELSFGDFQMEKGILQFAGDLHELTVTKLQISEKDSFLELSGKITRDNLDFKLSGHSINLEILQLKLGDNKLRGLFNAEGRLSGKPSSPNLWASVNGNNLAWGAFVYQHLAAELVWDSRGVEIYQAQLDDRDNLVKISGKIGTVKPAQLDLEIMVISFDIKEFLQIAKISQVEANGRMSGKIRINGPVDQPGISIVGKIARGVINGLPVTGEFDLDYSQNKVNIHKILLKNGTGSLLASGSWENGRLLKVSVQLNNFPLETINLYTNQSLKLAGLANSNIVLEWNDKTITGEYWLNITDFNLNGNTIGNVFVNGTFSDQGLLIQNGFLSFKRGELTGAGYVPWPVMTVRKLKFPVNMNGNLRNTDLTLSLKNVPAELINILAQNRFSVLTGEIGGDLLLKGDITEPQIWGKLSCSGVKLNIPDLPLSIDNFQANLLISENIAEIKRARGFYGKGRFNLNGRVELSGYQPSIFRLNLTGNRIYYKNYLFDGFGDLNISLTGTPQDSLLSGEVTIYNCKMGVLGNRPSQKGFSWKPNLDVAVRTGDNVRYRQTGLADVTVSGKINAKGDFVNPILEGKATSDKGVLTFYGQTFKINRASAIFSYSQGPNPYIDIDSSLVYPKVEVFLTIKGQIGGNLAINLTSQPFLSQSDLYALLNWSELNGDKPLTVNGVVSGNISFFTDTLFGDIFYELRKTLNVDYLYLERDFRQNDFRINVGDYLTDQLFLSYSRSVSNTPKDNWGLDLHFTPVLVLGGNYSLDDGTSWRLTYRLRF